MHVNCPKMGNIASFCMNNFWGPLKLNLPRAPNVLRPALVVDIDVCVSSHLKKSWLGLQIRVISTIMLFKNSYSTNS